MVYSHVLILSVILHRNRHSNEIRVDVGLFGMCARKHSVGLLGDVKEVEGNTMCPLRCENVNLLDRVWYSWPVLV